MDQVEYKVAVRTHYSLGLELPYRHLTLCLNSYGKRHEVYMDLQDWLLSASWLFSRFGDWRKNSNYRKGSFIMYWGLVFVFKSKALLIFEDSSLTTFWMQSSISCCCFSTFVELALFEIDYIMQYFRLKDNNTSGESKGWNITKRGSGLEFRLHWFCQVDFCRRAVKFWYILANVLLPIALSRFVPALNFLDWFFILVRFRVNNSL